MKQTPKSSIRTVVSSREAVALATLFSLANASAAETPAKKEDTTKKDKKKGEESDVLPEINVQAARENTYKTEALTSKKYTVPLRDVPQTVTVVPRQVIEEQNATTLTDILRNVPGITMAGGENGNAGTVGGDAVIMRGFDASSSVFADGVRDNSLASRDTFNTESAEIFMGPTGSDVGRGNASGYINLNTKVPHLGNVYQGGIQVGSADRQRYTLDLNQEVPLGKQDWIEGAAVRFNGVYQDSGIPGRDITERNIIGLAPSFAMGLGTDTRSFLTYQHIEQHNIPDYGLPANRNKKAPGVDNDWFYGTNDDYEDIEQNSFTARIEHDINEHFSLTNQTKFNQTTRYTEGTRPSYNLTVGNVNFGKVTRSAVVDDRENNILSNQTNFISKFDTGIFKHTLVTSLEYTKEKQDTTTLVGTATYPAIFPGEEPGHSRPPGFVDYTTSPGFTAGETETIGVSAFDTIEFNKKWILSGGLRMDHYNTYYRTKTLTAGTYLLSSPFLAGDEIFSGKVGLTYKPVEEGSIYVAYSSTTTPPGTGNFSVNATTNATSGAITSVSNVNADPQESENIELGAKWDFFDSKLTLTGAAFYTENTNFIYQDDPLDNTSYSSDGGQKIKGVSLGAAGKITENWSVLGSLTYLDGEIDQPGSLIDGNRLSRSPRWSGTLWTTYKLPKGFTAGLGMRAQDSVLTSTVDDSPGMAGFAQFDAMVQYDINENVNLRLNVYNLLDTRYVASTSGGGGGDGGGTGGTTGGGTDASGNRILMSAPINFALSANFKF